MKKTLDPSEQANEVKLGQVRSFTLDGHKALGLIFRDWMDGEIFLVCPVKDIDSDEEPTGVCVYAQPTPELFYKKFFADKGLWLNGYAMPALGGTVDVDRIKEAPIIGEVIPETVDQAWRIFRWSMFGEDEPDMEKDFHYFSGTPHSDSDWEKSYIVLGPLDPDDGYVLPDEPEPEPEPDEDELRRKGYAKVSEVEIPEFDSRDNWGPCCSHCEFRDQPHKPCAVCAV